MHPKVRIINILIVILVLALVSCSHAPAAPIKGKEVELPHCKVFERHTPAHFKANRATFIFLNGIPATSLIYKNLVAEFIQDKLPYNILQVDLPGTGKSRLNPKSKVSWNSQRQCVAEYLALKDNYHLLVHDIAGPVVLPLLPELVPKLKSIVILNTVIKPSKFRLIFPMSTIRNDPLGITAHLTPRWLFRNRFRKEGIARKDQVADLELNKLFSEVFSRDGAKRLTQVLKGFNLDKSTDEKIAKGLATNIPQLIIWAKSDRSLGPQFKFIQELPSAPKRRIEEIQEAKHFFMMDFAPEITAIIKEWDQR